MGKNRSFSCKGQEQDVPNTFSTPAGASMSEAGPPAAGLWAGQGRAGQWLSSPHALFCLLYRNRGPNPFPSEATAGTFSRVSSGNRQQGNQYFLLQLICKNNLSFLLQFITVDYSHLIL
jgi:hypothetical protein